MAGSDAPTVPVLDADEVARVWARRGPAALCVGGFGNPRDEPHDRIGLFDWPADGAEPVLDVWVPTSALETLAQGLDEVVRRGGWDTMYATGWTLAWAGGDDAFRTWLPGEGATLTLTAGRLWLKEGGELDRTTVEAVEGWLSDDWTERGVRLQIRGGGTHAVLTAEEPIANMGGPFYDGLDLLCDSGWIHDAGGALAIALGVSYVHGLG